MLAELQPTHCVARAKGLPIFADAHAASRRDRRFDSLRTPSLATRDSRESIYVVWSATGQARQADRGDRDAQRATPTDAAGTLTLAFISRPPLRATMP